MLIPKCPTCKTRLADKQIPYTIELSRICSMKDISEEEREQLKMKLLTDLELLRLCCKMRILTFKNLPDLLI